MPTARGTNRQRARPTASSVSDIIGRVVRIPASFYGIDVPGMMYRAKVLKRDNSHKNSVILSFFEDDGSLHWAPADDVREWIAVYGDGDCIGKESDQYAVETLLKFRELSRSSAKEIRPTDNLLHSQLNVQTPAEQDGAAKLGDFDELPILAKLRNAHERSFRQ